MLESFSSELFNYPRAAGWAIFLSTSNMTVSSAKGANGQAVQTCELSGWSMTVRP